MRLSSLFLLTFLKKSASEPVRLGFPLPAWGSEVMAVVRPGEAVSRNCVLIPPEDSQDWMGIRAMVRSLLGPAWESRLNWIKSGKKLNKTKLISYLVKVSCKIVKLSPKNMKMII